MEPSNEQVCRAAAASRVDIPRLTEGVPMSDADPDGLGIGPVAVQVLDRASAVDITVQAVQARAPRIVAFANAHTINVARRMPEFASALQRAIVLNDGAGIDLASWVLTGRTFPDNLNGTDLTPLVLDQLEPGTGVFLVGSPPGVAEKAAEAIQRAHPHIRIAGTQHGFFAAGDEIELAERIRRSGCGLVLAGMGNPRQELWAAANIDRIGAPVMCVGALLDFYAGVVPRAPAMVRRLRLEWGFRLCQEPRRMARRYLVGNVTFLLYIFALWRQRETSQG